MATEALAARPSRPRTERKDLWWLLPVTVFLAYTAFVIYTTWAGLDDNNYYKDPYLSPFYSPCLAHHCLKGARLWPVFGSWWALSPAILILAFPGGLRLTCYYYRKAYYRAFLQSPPNCAVVDAPKKYTGESRFPFILQNLHRYFFYASILILAVLWWDVIEAFHTRNGFFFGLGTIIMLVNAALLTSYSMSCHSCRYLSGGYLDRFFKAPVRYKLWRFFSRLNARHAELAWISMFSVALTDLYIRLVASGTISDWRIIGS